MMKAVAMVVAIGVCALGPGCASDPVSTQEINGNNALGTPGVISTNPEEGNGLSDAGLSVVEGPLCIGLAPPEDAYLPLEDPDALTADAGDPDTDTGTREPLGDGSAIDGQADGQEEVADGIIEPSDSVEEDEDSTPADTTGLYQTFADEEDAGANADASGDETDGSSPIFVPPPVTTEEEEEPEPYDCTPDPVTCPGATPPEFALFDFQPQSCGFQATYGMSLYKNHVTLVGLLAAW